MDKSVKKYKQRRDARIKKRKEREDEQWITMKGTHVLIDDGGQVKGGPDRVKQVVKQGGGYRERKNAKFGGNSQYSKYSKALNGGWSRSGNRPSESNSPDKERNSRTLGELEILDKMLGNPRKPGDAGSMRTGMTERLERPKTAVEPRRKSTGEIDRERGSRTIGEIETLEKMGLGKAKGESAPKEESGTYESFPMSFRVGGRGYASAEDNKKVKETVSNFMKNAKEGDVYDVGGGVGSGGAQFKVVGHRGKLGLQWVGSDRPSRPVEMSRSNVEKYIAGGAKRAESTKTGSQGAEEERDRKIEKKLGIDHDLAEKIQQFSDSKEAVSGYSYKGKDGKWHSQSEELRKKLGASEEDFTKAWNWVMHKKRRKVQPEEEKIWYPQYNL